MRNILLMHWVELLKQRREACGLTQTELAVQAGVSLPSIQKMEAGRANPSLKTLQSVFEVVGVDVEFRLKGAAISTQEKMSEKAAEKKGTEAPGEAKSAGLLEMVSSELNGLTKGPARERVGHLFRLIDKIAHSDRRPSN